MLVRLLIPAILLAIAAQPCVAWTTELNLTSDNPGAASPQIAVGPTGKVHVVYAHQPTGKSNLNLYYTYWTGSGWAAPQDLPGPNYKEPQCSIAVDSNDHVHVVGIYRPYDPDITKPYTVFYWEYDGTNWTGPVQLSSGEGRDPYDNATSPRVAIDKNNDVHVVWAHDNMVGGESDILYRKRQGGVWLATQNITANRAGTSYGSSSPDLAVDANGNTVHVVWHDDFLNNGFQVYYTKNTSLGDAGAWLPSSQWTQLSTGDYGKAPSIVLDRNDCPNVWWTDRFGGSANVMAYARLTSTGWTAAANWGGQWFQGATFDQNNLMHYLYTSPNSSGTIELFYKTYNYVTSSTAQLVSTGDNTLKVDGGALSVDASGIPHALWLERKGAWPGLSYIFYSKGIYSPPPGPLTSFTASPVTGSTSQIRLTWTNPTSANYAGTVIRYRFDTYPVDQFDGNLLTDRFAAPGSSDSFVHTGLQSGQVVYYAAFAHNADYVFSTGLTAWNRTHSQYNDHGLVGTGKRVFALAATPSGDFVYTGTDGLDTARGTFGRYNRATNTWSQIPGFPFTGRILSLIVHSSGKVYGIQSGSGYSNPEGNGRWLWSYNPANGTFSSALYTGPVGSDLRGELDEGPDGRVWFGDMLGNLIVHDPKTLANTVYNKPAGVNAVLMCGIEPMADGNVYCVFGSYRTTEDQQFELCKLNSKTGQWTKLHVPASVGNEWICTPLLLANDGCIYGLTQRATGRIIKIDPATDTVYDLGPQLPSAWGGDGCRLVGGDWTPTGRLYWGSSRDASNNAHTFFFDRKQSDGTSGSKDNGTLPPDCYDITSVLYSNGRVYFGVRTDAGTARLFSFDVAGTAPSPALKTLKDLADNTSVTLNTQVVTGAFGDHFYIEDADRSAGIKVASNASVAVGSMVSVTGTLEAVAGERQITTSSVAIYSGGNGVPKPFFWTMRDLGGGRLGNIPGLHDSFGLNNVGLLGKVAGNVSGISRTDSAFYVDDGSNTLSDEGFTGVKVLSNKPVTVGQYVVVTGISSVAINEQGQAIRQLKTRTTEDVQVLQ